NAEKETVSACQLEALNIEDWMIGHRQTIEREQTEYRRKGGDKDRQLKCHRNERRPTVQRTAADIDRVVDHSDPVLEVKSTDAPDQTADKDDQRDSGLMKAECLGQSIHGKRRIGIHAAKSFCIGFVRRLK